MFTLTKVETRLDSQTLVDIADEAALLEYAMKIRPHAILHLAAQPLVLASYANPVETFRTNVQGTVNILEVARRIHSVQGIVAVTTDKVYANDGTGRNFTETARIGGYDPYSASNAAAEMAIDGYRLSLSSWGRDLAVETARGGNIIGGGDWSANRIIPDYARAVASGEPLIIRNPLARRPWQHVLCLIHGYLTLLNRILSGETVKSDQLYGEAWNFGPEHIECVTVQTLLDKMAQYWTSVSLRTEAYGVYEAAALSIDPSKARNRIKWQPTIGLDEAVFLTAQWYQTHARQPDGLVALTEAQIDHYFQKTA